MKIRDLNLDDYVIVYDIGKSENSEGMTVVGKVARLRNYVVAENENEEDGYTVAVIESIPDIKYTITDDNYFNLWSNSIKDKTESVNNSKGLSGFTVDKELLEKAKEKGIDELRKNILQSNDLQQRKRRNIKLIDSETVEFENGRQMKVIINNRKTKPTSVYWVDDKTIGFDNGSRVRVPEYYTRENSNDTVNHPSHYNYGEIEVIDFIEQVTQHYNPNVAYHIGNAIKYIARSPHKNGKEDIAKAKWYIERAFENWDVK